MFFFVMSQFVCLITRFYTTLHLHQVFCDVALIFSPFSLVFRTSNSWSLRNLINPLFHSRLLDMRLVIADSAPRASLAIHQGVYDAEKFRRRRGQVMIASSLERVLQNDLTKLRTHARASRCPIGGKLWRQSRNQ